MRFFKKFSASSFQKHLIRNQRDEFSVRRLFRPDIGPDAQNIVDALDPSAVPGDLDGMADRAFHLARRRIEPFADARDRAPW